MKASDFDRKFENGEDLTEFIDLSKAKKSNQKLKKVNIEIPSWLVERLDNEAKKLGVSRQAIIRVWLAERFEKVS